MNVHLKTAAKMFGVREEDVTPAQLAHAKAVNFGIQHGIAGKQAGEEVAKWLAEGAIEVAPDCYEKEMQ